jgi:hypothetical protein
MIEILLFLLFGFGWILVFFFAAKFIKKGNKKRISNTIKYSFVDFFF